MINDDGSSSSPPAATDLTGGAAHSANLEAWRVVLVIPRAHDKLEIISMKLLRWMCLFLSMLWAGSAFVQAQTIADAAREERQRRKAVESETSVSIPMVTSVTPATTARSAVTTRVKAATANEKSKSTGPTDLQGHDENYWRPKFDAARLAVKRAEANLKLLDLRVNQTSQKMPGWSGIIARQERDIARKDLADAQQNLADLEDQLRRSGGLPVWSRPR